MKSVGIAYVLWFFFGVFGVHRFYCGRVGTGILWFLTAGLLGIGWLVDMFLIPAMVRECDREFLLFQHSSAVPRSGMPPPGLPVAETPRRHRVVFCTRCGSAMQVPAESTGSAYACPACGTVLRIPAEA